MLYEDLLVSFVWIAVALFLLPMGAVVLEALSALILPMQKPTFHPNNTEPSTVVLISAHNEEHLIGSTLDSLKPELSNSCHVVWVAHNYT